MSRYPWLLLSLILSLGCGNSESNGEDVLQDPPIESEPVITFLVTVPESTPLDAEIWISGNTALLGSWNGRGLQTEKQTDGTYRAAQSTPAETRIEFKITRGNWETVEKGSSGEEISNRTHLVTESDTLDLTVATWRDQVEGPPPSHTLTGSFQHHSAVSSQFLGHDRDVIVYLPPMYEDEPEGHYPVLYMHDGQNVFDRATAFIGIEWEVDETAERLIPEGSVEPIIVVGVYNSPDRVAEYTHIADPGHGGGNADSYGRFLVEELKPFIDETYRTLPDRDHTGIAGSSLGGLVSIYFALSLSETFSRIGVVSPTVFWADEDIVRLVNEAEKVDARIWLDMGTREGSTPQGQLEALESVRRLRDALISKGWALGEDLEYFEDEGAEHNETAWAGRMERILEFLYPVEAGVTLEPARK